MSAGHAPRKPLLLRAYRMAGHVATPFIPSFLARRQARGKEDGARIGERQGHAGLPRPAGRLVWLHAASVGETMSILPLIGKLSEKTPVLLTTGTVTSAEIAAKRLPAGAIHQFVPVDTPGAVARFLDHWRPDLGLFCESELWPNLMMTAHERNIPLGIVNGRMSARSYKGWSRLGGTLSALLSPLAFCLAQSEEDAARFAALGAPAEAAGNLKFDVPALPFDMAERDALREAIGPRPVLLAASTHPREEEIVLEAAAMLRAEHPALLTIIVPRHPARGEEIASLAASGGMGAAQRSLGARPDALDVLHIADTLGELGLFYALADVALVGGSLVPHGGHNPIEPAKLGTPILSGPHVMNFAAIFAMLGEAGGYRRVEGASALAQVASELIAAPDARTMLAANARAAFFAHEGALARTLERIAQILPEPG